MAAKRESKADDVLVTGNKGEWSEIYTLFKLLGERDLYAGNAELDKLDVIYPILSVLRGGGEPAFSIEDKSVVVVDSKGDELLRLRSAEFLRQAEALLDSIKEGDGSAFSVPSTQSFMRKLGCKRLKAPSSDKTDIKLVLHDFRTGMNPCLGFSIKSELGGNPTILNASQATNITYKLVGAKLRASTVKKINLLDKQDDRMQAIRDLGCTLEFFGIENSTFKNNLLFVDGLLPELVAHCILESYASSGSKTVKQVVARVAKENPFNYGGANREAFYLHKFKRLLLDAALGMKPATEWNGFFEANGGYIVVRADGELVCFHFYNRNEIEEYLVSSAYFERPSRGQHGYGSIYQDANGETFIKLNLQLRWGALSRNKKAKT